MDDELQAELARTLAGQRNALDPGPPESGLSRLLERLGGIRENANRPTWGQTQYGVLPEKDSLMARFLAIGLPTAFMGGRSPAGVSRATGAVMAARDGPPAITGGRPDLIDSPQLQPRLLGEPAPRSDWPATQSSAGLVREPGVHSVNAPMGPRNTLQAGAPRRAPSAPDAYTQAVIDQQWAAAVKKAEDHLRQRGLLEAVRTTGYPVDGVPPRSPFEVIPGGKKD